MNDNKTLLLVIALLLAGIFGVMVYRETHKTPAEKIQEGLSDAASGVGDAVQKMGADIKKNSH